MSKQTGQMSVNKDNNDDVDNDPDDGGRMMMMMIMMGTGRGRVSERGKGGGRETGRERESEKERERNLCLFSFGDSRSYVKTLLPLFQKLLVTHIKALGHTGQHLVAFLYVLSIFSAESPFKNA